MDSQAGDAYYWFVIPCIDWSLTTCGPDPTTIAGTSASAYRKYSQPADIVQPLTTTSATNPPVQATTIPDQVTFNWGDYLDTSKALTYPNDISTRVALEAKQYQITVATSSDFNAGSIQDNAVVTDATQYTPYAKTYPEGPLYWKVQAVDWTGNVLTTSTTGLVIKSSAPITLTSPAQGAAVAGLPYFTWLPQNWAYQYTIELYKNADLNFSLANRVAYATTYIPAWSPTGALARGTYAWRVQRLDRDHKPGPWSVGRTFTLNPDAPTLPYPADQASVDGTDVLFSWTGPSNAVTYNFQTSSTAAFSSAIESVNTAMSSWSPIRTYTTGSYYWRVNVLDASSNVLSTSSVRAFLVGIAPPPSTLTSTYHPISPVRVLDTRHGIGLATKLPANSGQTFAVVGGSIPDWCRRP